jgi:hypothetical protein
VISVPFRNFGFGTGPGQPTSRRGESKAQNMNASSAIVASQNSRAFPAIFFAGLLCGIMGISAAFITWYPKGIMPARILRGIAAGVLGPKSITGGWHAALLGLAIHFFIAFSAATVFYLASRHFHGSPTTYLWPYLWRPRLPLHVLGRHAALRAPSSKILLVQHHHRHHHAHHLCRHSHRSSRVPLLALAS